MQINLSNEQYQDLIKMVFMGNMIINSIKDNEKRIKKYDEIEQSLYQYAREADMDKYLTYLPDQNRYVLSREFIKTSDLKTLAAKFVDSVFWGELTNRLASRDTVNKYGSAALKSGTLNEYNAKQAPFLKKYKLEFQKNGLENIKIK